MDLLGRKAQRELSKVRSEFAGALIALIATQTTLKRTNDDYRSALLLLQAKTKDIEMLKARLVPVPRPVTAPSFSTTEYEEDLDWAVGAELIAAEQAADILRELNFDHHDVMVDESMGISSLTY